MINMITLTETDIIQLLRKNNLNADTLQEDVVAELLKNRLKVATAESCTGGLISQRITSVSGSSEVFDCGICSYANEIKHKVLGVSEDTLNILGAVSAETAIQMAEGVKRLSGADIGISTTGVAGPLGGTPEKPVGLVFCGVCTADSAYAIRLDFSTASNRVNARNYIRKLTSDSALFTILNTIHNQK